MAKECRGGNNCCSTFTRKLSVLGSGPKERCMSPKRSEKISAQENMQIQATSYVHWACNSLESRARESIK
jgi:hypothetical protein